MSAAHMPGPWIVTEEMGSNIIRSAEETRAVEGVEGATYKWRDYVASTWGGPHEANARLIAAAPDLLAALRRIDMQTVGTEATNSRDLADWRDDIGAIQAVARAAIAEATGGKQ